MNRSILLPAAYLIDHLAGDPEWLPHPVRLMGSATTIGESQLRRLGHSPGFNLFAGAGLTLVIVGASYRLTVVVLRLADRHSSVLGSVAELMLAWTCLAARNLEQEATAVTGALEAGNLLLAQTRLSRIVGRDTASLNSYEVSRAVVETVAESACDGIIAPLFYMALGGVPLAMAYKAINTLDSMIGHANSRYFYFGKAAARLDDAANYLPSRLSALIIVAAAKLMNHADPRAAWSTWQRDGPKHKSPNAGQPESAMAGALHVRLGGSNTYRGELVPASLLGAEFAPPTPDDAVAAIRLVSAAALIGLCLGTSLSYLLRPRKARRT